MSDSARGTLYVVSTPIGNLGDWSPRAARTLKSADLVVAEDTRHSRPLLAQAGIATRVESYHAHNEAKMTPRLVRRMTEGATVALITDAGTPLVSDPGSRLVRAAIAAGIEVVPIPGPSAVLAALAAGGLSTDRFTFFGFAPRARGERAAFVADVVACGHTAVVFEAPGRTAALLADLAAAGAGQRESVLARELTKLHEEFRRGTVAELAAAAAADPPVGEVVVMVAGAPPEGVDEARLRVAAGDLRAGGRSARDVARVLSTEWGAPRNLAYRIAHEDAPAKPSEESA